MVDGIVIGLILLSAVFGLIRGIVSQIMALFGLVAAYWIAPVWGLKLGGFVQEELGCSRFMAEKASIFLVGLTIYIVARLVGYGIEKLFVNRVRELWKVNRVGGAVLGAVKTTALIAVVFFFLALVPTTIIQAWTPKVMESQSYQLAAKHNPMGSKPVLESMRKLRSTVNDPQKHEDLEKNPAWNKLLTRHELENALKDRRFLTALEEGDFDQLRKNERVEKFMKDEELTELLAQLDQVPDKN